MGAQSKVTPHINKLEKYLAVVGTTVAAGILLLAAGVWMHSSQRTPIPPKQTANVWLVRCSPAGTGSGFPVVRKDNQVGFLTARHVAQHDATSVELRGITGTVRSVEVHPELDIAILWVEGLPQIPVFEMSARQPRFGDPVFGAGHALGGRLAVTFGFVGDPTNTATSATIYGFSGGPVMRPDGVAIGVAVGIMVAYNAPISSFSNFIPLSDAQDWLKQRGAL